MRDRRAAARLGVVGALVLFGCSPELPREVAARPFVTRVGAPDPRVTSCRIAEELRPALGCPDQIPFGKRGPATVDERGSVEHLRVSGPRRDRRVLVERLVRGDRWEYWRRLPSRVMHTEGSRLDVPFEGVSEEARRVVVHSLNPLDEQWVSAELTIGRGAALHGSFALETLGTPEVVGRVAFRVAARRGTEVLARFERTIDAATDSGQWLDYALDLASLSGEAVTLELSTRAVDDGSRGGVFTGYPVFGVPRVVAPGRGARRLRGAILVSLDTLRADHVGAYGAGRAETPHLDALAAESLVLETAVATSPATTASHMSMLTGLYPAVHGVYGPVASLSERVPTAAETLGMEGLTTAAFTENGMIATTSGFARGFDRYREFRGADRGRTGRVADVVDAGLAWLEAHRDQRFFLFLHTYQVHAPYEPPEAFVLPEAQTAPTEAARQSLAYAGEVAYTDTEIGRLLAGLAELGLEEDVALLVTSDHGEAFGEHGFGHGFTLNEEAIRVPMILRVPGRVEPSRISTPVSLVDILPTFFELLDVEEPSPMQGRSLLEIARQAQQGGLVVRAVYAERLDGDEVAVHRASEKWILNTRDPAASRAFDLSEDPAEREARKDASSLEAGLAEHARYRAEAHRMKAQLQGATVSPAEVDDATLRELRALGYLE